MAETKQRRDERENSKAFIYPLLQIPGTKFVLDQTVLMKTFEYAPENSKINLATGYFNLTQDYEDSIVSKSKAFYNVLVSSPEANGFFNAAGVAKNIPTLYSFYEYQFFNQVNLNHQQDRIKIHEYKRDNWTYHAKGLWYYPANSSVPSMTIVGSSNFSHRSAYRDFEAQFLIHSKNADLQKRLHKVSDSQLTLETPCLP
jgi:CDP-diacylglycerol--glycerol-3-phosphate 3-phosphatidyltransferase